MKSLSTLNKKTTDVKGGPDYRPDIDGLRAIAVLSVILFHFNGNWLPGGFIGVDIFFVISGFLITQLLRKNLLQKKFTFSNFYARRIRRIAPALITMLVFTSIAAFFILRPYELSSFAKSLGSQAVSLQNFFFLSEGQYFIGAESKPLLHTWSLAVEEQFYLLWPLFLLWTCNWKRRDLFIALFLIVAVSFSLNLVAIKISPKSSFFLLPTRAWELGVGGMSAIFLERKVAVDVLDKYSVAIGWAGALLITLSLVLINSTMPFPGMVAIFPVMGTMLLISAHQPGSSILGRILGNKLLVYIGIMSYGLYLWHWPVFAYAHYLGINLHAFGNALAAFLLIAAFTYLTYRYIETPIRQRLFLRTPVVLARAFVVSLVALLVVSFHLWITQGAAYRYPRAAQPFLTAGFNSRSDRCGFMFRVTHLRDEVCPLNKSAGWVPNRRVLLWGNSHADMWSGMLLNLADANHALLYLNAKNCRSTIYSTSCNAMVQARIISFITQNKVTDVVLASTWYGSYHIDDAIFERSLMDTVAQLAKTQANIWLVVDAPSSQSLDPLSSYLSRPNAPSYGVMLMHDEKASESRQLRLFESIAKKFDRVKIIDATKAYCGAVYCTDGGEGEVWYRDGGHITDEGARAAKEYFMPIFK